MVGAMSWLDAVLVTVLVASGVRGFFRAAWVEIAGVLEFCGAVAAAKLIAPTLRTRLGEWLAVPEGLAAGLAFGLSILVAGSGLYLCVRTVRRLRSGVLARAGGAMIGLGKGIVVACLLAGLVELFGRGAGVSLGLLGSPVVKSVAMSSLQLLREGETQ